MEAQNVILEDLLEFTSSSNEVDVYPLFLERNYFFNIWFELCPVLVTNL